MCSSIHWSTHSEKEFWIRREFRKSRGWRDGTLIASFTHRESLRGERKTLTQRTKSIPKNLSSLEKYLKTLKRFLGGKLQVLPDCAASKVSSFLKVWLKEVNSTGRRRYIGFQPKKLGNFLFTADTERETQVSAKLSPAAVFLLMKVYVMCYCPALPLDGKSSHFEVSPEILMFLLLGPQI